MASGDGLLVRVKPPYAVLAANAAKQLAMAVARYGNGIIELTSHAAIQVRGLSAEAARPFATAMVAAGLADAEPDVERRRSVIVTPLADARIRAVAAVVEASLVRDQRLAPLPPKFAVSLDGYSVLPFGDIGADICVVCADTGCSVTLAGTGVSVTVAANAVPETVVRFALAFLENRVWRSPTPRVLKGIGWLPDGDDLCGAFGLGLPFGTTTVDTLAPLTALSEEYADGTLRITPWRAVLVPGVPAAAVGKIREAGRALGLIVDPADPRNAIITCPGKPACASGSVPARSDAMRLVELRLPATVHVSGCAKGCAHPAPASITLVGENGLYGIVRNGRAADAPSDRNLTLPQVMALLRA